MRTRRDVPRGIDGVTPQWLTAALGADVTGVRAEQIAMDSGFSSLLYRLHMTGDDVPVDVDRETAAQCRRRAARWSCWAATDVSWRSTGTSPDMRRWQRRDVLRRANSRRNRVDFVLLLEDLPHWDNADHLAGLSMDRARTCIEHLAGLHAWSADRANAHVLETVSEHRHPDGRDLLVPAFAPGWQVYLENCASLGAGSARARSPSDFARARGGGAARVDRTRHAAPRRHPGRQPVLRRRRR